MGNTKHVSLDIKGNIEVVAYVTSNRHGKINSGKYRGYAQTKKSDSKDDLVERGLKDCVFQHFRQIGVMSNNRFNDSGEELGSFDYSTRLISHKMNYVNLVKIKRVAKKLKGRRIIKNNKAFTQISDEDNNIISTEKYKSGDVKRINTKKSKTYLIETRDKKSNEVLKLEKPNYIK